MISPRLSASEVQGPFEKWGRLLLVGLPVLALAGIGVLAGLDKAYLALVLPAGALLPFLLLAAYRWPVLHYAILFSLFVVAAGNSAGIGAPEILFGLYYVPFLGWWYVSRVALFQERLIVQRGDGAIALFIVLVCISALYGIASGNKASVAISELASFTLLAFYFPFREFSVRVKNGRYWLITFLLLMGLVATMRNMVNLSAVFASALDLRGIAYGRAVQAEVLIYSSAVAGAALMLFARQRMAMAGAVAGFLVCALGVVFTQYRSFYLAVAVALLVLFLVVDRGSKVRLVSVVSFSGIAAFGLAMLLFGDVVLLILGGVIDRALSIGTASDQDISFINRFNEYRVVIPLIAQSPIIGHGLGSEFGFFDAIFSATWVKPYVHNGYLHLLYKMGVTGFFVLGYAVWCGMARSWITLRSDAPPDSRAAAAFCLALVVGLAVAANATVMYNTDMILPLTIALAVASSTKIPGPQAQET